MGKIIGIGFDGLALVHVEIDIGTYIVFNAELPGIDVALVGLGSPGMFHRKTLESVACLV